MKIGIYKAATLTLLLTCACAAVMSGCRSDQGTDGSSGGLAVVPHGYMARLEQVHDGRMIGFGPFVGYYFRPEDPEDLSWLRFVCFNENRFYSSGIPDGAKLYEGTALRATRPGSMSPSPPMKGSIRYFFRKRPRPGATHGRSPGTNLCIFTRVTTVRSRC